MKQMRNVLQRLVVCGVALAMVGSVAAQTTTQGKAKVVRIVGSARYTVGGGAWQPLRVGAVLEPGAVIQTSAEKGSLVDLVLGDGAGAMPMPVSYVPGTPFGMAASGMGHAAKSEQNTVRVMENSVLGIDKLTAMQTGNEVVTETQLDLKAGKILGNVKKMSAASKYEVKLPNGVAGIRGTAYLITADGLIQVLYGSVVVAYVDSGGNVVTQVVGEGYSFDTRTGGQPNFIPPELLESLRSMIPTGIVTPSTTTTVVTPDRTIYYTVSPNEGGP